VAHVPLVVLMQLNAACKNASSGFLGNDILY
jgi:hypothetical protein